MIWCSCYSNWCEEVKKTIPVRIMDGICDDDCKNCRYGGKKNED